MGKLVVEVNGHRFENLAEVPNPSLRQRLMAAVGELIVFTDGYNTLVEAGVAPPLMVDSRGHLGGQGPVSDSIERRQAAFLANLERERDVLAAQAKMVAVDPATIVAAAKKGKPTLIKRPTSILSQIDEILQKYIAAEPNFEGRSIHFEQAPAGGLRIKVDGEVYQKPAEIKDKEVQLVIKMALKEWEAG
jgi:hypothetical protein